MYPASGLSAGALEAGASQARPLEVAVAVDRWPEENGEEGSLPLPAPIALFLTTHGVPGAGGTQTATPIIPTTTTTLPPPLPNTCHPPGRSYICFCVTPQNWIQSACRSRVLQYLAGGAHLRYASRPMTSPRRLRATHTWPLPLLPPNNQSRHNVHPAMLQIYPVNGAEPVCLAALGTLHSAC